MPTMMFLELAVSTGMLVALLWIAVDTRAIRNRLLADPQRSSGHFSLKQHCGDAVSGSFVIWEWRKGEWRADVESLPTGKAPGQPPEFPGAQEGHRVKTWASVSQS